MDNFEQTEDFLKPRESAAAGNLNLLELSSDKAAEPFKIAGIDLLPHLSISDMQSSNPDSSEKHVQDLVAQFQPEQAERFKQYSDNFKTRSNSLGISEEEQTKTFDSLEKLLQTSEKDGALMSDSNRALLAVEFMYHAADPSTIDQGQWNTCGASTIEERMFARFPSKVADMVQQVALTGEWKAPDGKMINVGDKDVLSTWMAGQHPPIDGDRTLVSQVFQVTALNDLAQHGELDGYKGLNAHYAELNGEAMVLMEGEDQPGPFQGITSESIQRELSRLSGDADPLVLINTAKDHGANKGIIHFDSQEQFKAELERLKNANDFPAILSVYGNQPPFNDPYSAGHVVSVSDLRQNPNGSFDVYIDNQWGKVFEGADGWYPLDQIYRSTMNAAVA